MKTRISTAVAALVAGVASAQQTSFVERVSLEAGYGYNLALNPAEGISSSDVSALKSVQAGANYHFNKIWGMRGTYMFNQFEVKDAAQQSLQVHKLALEATYDITEAIQPNLNSKFKNGFAVEAHAGAGLSMGISGVPEYSDDLMANLQVGIMPLYHFDKQWAVFVDATMTQYLKQNFNFNGAKALNDGQVLTFNVGVRYNFGK